MDRPAKFSKADSRRMYSWWWDSHISPKNSKWLQENLTDMDSKVKQMIKLIEEDADSFARRAEMYYKKRPELMKMVEEFYRAYRALAERYDHATGVIRHAHRTMSEAFPNQVMFADDSPVVSVSGIDSRSSDPSTPNGEFTDESDSVARRKASVRFLDEFVTIDHARRGLNFDELEEKEENADSLGNSLVKSRDASNSNHHHDSEEIVALKEAIAKLEAEKEAGISQYHESLDKLSKLEAEMAKTKEDFGVLSDHAKKGEHEIIILNNKLGDVEADKESNLQKYQESVEKISKLQKEAQKLNERVEFADIEAQSLKSELEKLEVEKDVSLKQYVESLDTISNLENKLLLVEEDVKMLKERAEKAEIEIELLKETAAKLSLEKETAAQKHQQCLDTISALEEKLKGAQEEAKRLNFEITSREAMLKGAEEQFFLLEKSNKSLHTELEALILKMGSQSHELMEKQKEVGMLWAGIQEERLRFVEAETAFQTLQHLHGQTQEELRAVASELQHTSHTLRATESEKQSLQDDVSKVMKEKKQLEELNASFELSVKDMMNEISILVESKGKLDDEIEMRLNQENALQQDIVFLKEELKDLNEKHLRILLQVQAVGLNAESLESSVKELRNENCLLQENWQRESSEKSVLLSKLSILDHLLEKNAILEASVAELEASRRKIEKLEHSLQSLLNEKTTILNEKLSLAFQLEESNNNFAKLSQDNLVLGNSLSDAQHQLEAFIAKSSMLENSHQLLVNEKVGLKSDYDDLSRQLEETQMKLKDLEKLNGDVEKRCVDLQKARESNLCKVEELQLSLAVERQEHSNYMQICETQFGKLETEIDYWQEKCRRREGELDQVMDKTINNDIELFVLSTTALELKGSNDHLWAENLKLSDEFLSLERKLSELTENYLKQQTEIKALFVQNRGLRTGAHQLQKALGVDVDFCSDDKGENDEFYFNPLLSKLQNMKDSRDEEKIEATVLLHILHAWIRQLIEMNEELRSELRDVECSKEAQMRQNRDLLLKLKDVHGSFQALCREKSELHDEKSSLTNRILQLEERNSCLEDENRVLFVKVLNLDNITSFFRSFADEGISMMQEIMADLTNLRDVNATLVGKLSLTEGSLEETEILNLHLKEKQQKMEEELEAFVILKNELNEKIESGEKLLQQTALNLKLAEEKLVLEKFESNRQVEDLNFLYNEIKMSLVEKEDQILNLSSDSRSLRNENALLHEKTENLELVLQNKSEEIRELESGASRLFCQLQCFMVSQLLYEQKWNELHKACLGYMDQNQGLETELGAFALEIESLKECLFSLEDHTAVHSKLQHSKNSKPEDADFANGSEESTLTELHDIRARLRAAVKAVIKENDHMIQESADLHSKLDASTKQIELLQTEVQNMRIVKPKSEITGADAATLLTKDVELYHVSNGSSLRRSQRHTVDGNHVMDCHRSESVQKGKYGVPTSDSFAEDDLTLDVLEISKKSPDASQEGNKGKILQRLDSDVQKLVNLQITIQDLKRKLDVTEKQQRGKAVVMCEALKGQLEEADSAILKLFDVNERLMKNIDNKSSFDIRSFSSFDFEGEDGGGARRRKLSLQACRMSEKIGRLQLEVQKLQLALLKLLDDEKGGKPRSSIRRRILLRDYLYGRGAGTTAERRKKALFCACLQPSTTDD